MFTISPRYARILFAVLVICWLSLLAPTAAQAMSFQRPARWQVSGYSGVAWSPTGECLAIAQNDGSVVLLNPDDGTVLHTLRGNSARVFYIAFSPDGQTLATNGWDKSIDLWNVKDGTLVDNLTGHTCMVSTIAFSPDGQTMASGSQYMYGGAISNEIRIWRVKDRKLLRVIPSPECRVVALVFSTDGQTIISADNSINIWNVADGKLLHTFPKNDKYARAVALSPDGQFMATAKGFDWDQTGAVLVRQVKDGKLLYTIPGVQNDSIMAITFSPNGKSMLVGSGHAAKLYTTSDGTLLRTFLYGDDVFSVGFSPDGLSVFACGMINAVKIWRIEDRILLHTFSGETYLVTSAAISPDGKTIATGTGTEDSTLKLWQVSDGRLLYSVNGGRGGVVALAFSPDGTTIASGGGNIWNANDGKLLRTLTCDYSIQAIAYSPDGRTLATGGHNKAIDIWNVEDGQKQRSLTGDIEVVNTIAFSPDGLTLVAGVEKLTENLKDGNLVFGMEKTIKIWDVKDGTLVRTIDGYQGSGVVISPDGTSVATGGKYEPNVKILSIKNGTLLRTIMGYSGASDILAYSPDGKTLAVCGGGWQHQVISFE